MFKIFLSCSHKKTSPEGEWGDARRAGGGLELNLNGGNTRKIEFKYFYVSVFKKGTAAGQAPI